MKTNLKTDIFERIHFLREFPLFDSLSEGELYQLSQKVEEKITRKHHFIYLAGDPCTSLYFLYKGTVKIGIHSDEAKEVIKNIIHPMTMFGEWSALGEEKRSEFAQAMDHSAHYFVLNSDIFKELMRNNFEFSQKVFMMLGRKLKNTERRLESLIIKDARTRIIEFLKDNAKNFGRQVGFEMLLNHSLTQQDIANFTGTSRQTVTSVLNDLKKSNQIHFKRKTILIRDMASLA